MTFHTFRGNVFEHTHENHAFNQLHDLLQAEWSAKDEPLYLFGNFFVGGKALDALVVKRNAIIVLDFKDYGGDLKFSENGRWMADGVEVKGGNSINPYQQIRSNKFSLLDYIKSRQVNMQSSPNLGHIAGLVLFQRDTQFDSNTIPPAISRWFHVADFSRAIRSIDAIVSKEIDLPDADLKALVSEFDVPTYRPDGRPEVVSVGDPAEMPSSTIAFTNAQQKALAACDGWLDSEAQAAIVISGMISTGKRTLLQPITEKISGAGLSPQLIAPNSRIARRYIQMGYECHSVYQLIYSGKPDEIVDGRSHHPVTLKEEDVVGQALVFVEAHLLSNGFFATDNTIYGTGHIIDDLMGAFGKKPPKIALFGDPYQLSRGSLDLSLLNAKAFDDRGLQYDHILLGEQIRPDDAPGDLLEFQASLAGSLEDAHFNRLPPPSGEHIVELKTDEQRRDVSQAITSGHYQAVYLCGKNETAQSVNRATKTQILQHPNPDRLAVGDRVDFHNRTPALDESDDPFNFDDVWINAGEISAIERVEELLETRSIRLKGRNTDTTMSFGFAWVRLPGTGLRKIRYLQDYLSTERPELDQDQLLAMQIWARREAEKKLEGRKAELEQLKERESDRYKDEKKRYDLDLNRLMMVDGYFNAARLRFAYAMTVHRAQGRQWQHVIVNAGSSSDTSSPDNASYFRWLYTATVCATDRVSLMKYPELGPLSNVIWKDNPQCQIAAIQLHRKYYYDKERVLTEEDNSVIPPLGFEKPVPQLALLMLSIRERLYGTEWEIEKIAQHDYQEQYWFVNRAGKQVKGRISYNADYTVTNVILAGDDARGEVLNELWGLLDQKPEFQSWEVGEAVSAVGMRLRDSGINIVSVEEKPYRVLITLKAGDEAVTLEVNVGNKGMVSTIRPLKASSEKVIKRVEAALSGG